MLRYFLLFLSAISLTFSAQGVFGPVQTLPPSYTAGVEYLYSTYNHQDNNVFMTWPDSALNSNLWFAVYNPQSGSFSTEPTQIQEADQLITTASLVTSCHIEKNNSMCITWADIFNNVWFAVYNCTTKEYLKPPVPILTDYKTTGDVFTCYNPQDNTVFITWANATPGEEHPVYAILDCENNSFSTLPTLLSLYFRADSDVIPLYNPNNNTIFITWADKDAYNPYYAIFDCNKGVLSTQPTQLDKDKYKLGINGNLSSTLITHANQVFLSWNQNDNDGGVWYAIYDYNQDKIIQEPTSLASSFSANIYPENDVIPCYYPVNNTVFISWAGYNGNYYAVYDCSTKNFSEQATLISNTTANYASCNDVQPILINKGSSLFLSWGTTSFIGAFQTYIDKKAGIKKIFKEKTPVDYQKGF